MEYCKIIDEAHQAQHSEIKDRKGKEEASTSK